MTPPMQVRVMKVSTARATQVPQSMMPALPIGRSGPELSRREQLLAYVADYIGEHAIPPTIREMRDALNYSSVSMVSYDVRALIAEGKLIKTAPNGSARGFMLATVVNTSKRVAQLEAVLADVRTAIRESNFSGMSIREARALKAELLAKFDGALVSEVRA